MPTDMGGLNMLRVVKTDSRKRWFEIWTSVAYVDVTATVRSAEEVSESKSLEEPSS